MTSTTSIFRLVLPMLLASCASVQESKPLVATNPHPQVVNYALSLQGAPYRYGKDNPRDGFDCSGFVRHVYQKTGINLPHNAKDMALTLPEIPLQAITPGDLVFFDINGKAYSHVGIYIKNNNFIHAPSQRTGKVMVSNLNTPYWQKHFVGARRP